MDIGTENERKDYIRPVSFCLYLTLELYLRRLFRPGLSLERLFQLQM